MAAWFRRGKRLLRDVLLDTNFSQIDILPKDKVYGGLLSLPESLRKKYGKRLRRDFCLFLLFFFSLVSRAKFSSAER